MKSEFDHVFARLRSILQKHGGTLSVKDNSPVSFSLEGNVGPAALRAWGGKAKRSAIPVAWVQVGKAYVSYHLMGVYENARLLDGMSKELKTRMQGKTCFNFKSIEETLFQELDQLTAKGIAAFQKARYVANQPRNTSATVANSA